MNQVNGLEVMQALRINHAARLPTLLLGQPGVGKSANVFQFAESHGVVQERNRQRVEGATVLFIEERAGTMDITDSRGIPFLYDSEDGDKRTGYASPGFLPTKQECARYQHVFMFFDEITNATIGVQGALYQLVNDRRLGDYVLPDNVYIIAAGNRTEDKAAANRLSTALMDRFDVLTLVPDVKAWSAWAMRKSVHTAVIAFANWKPEVLSAFDPKANGPTPTPRGLEHVSRMLQAMQGQGENVSASLLLAMISGKLGSTHGPALVGFLDIYKSLPDIAAILRTPHQIPLVSGASVTCAVVAALAKRATAQDMVNAFAYVERMAREYQMIFVSMLTKEQKNSSGFSDWVIRNQEWFKMAAAA